MKIRLYLDEDSSQKALLQALRNADIDVISTLEVENLSRLDPEQLFMQLSNSVLSILITWGIFVACIKLIWNKR